MSGTHTLVTCVALAALIAATAPSSRAATADRFPELLPATPGEAIDTLAGDGGHLPCLTSHLQSVRRERGDAIPAARRALAILSADVELDAERLLVGPDGLRVLYTDERSALDRLDPRDADGDGRSDLLQTYLDALDDARALLVERLQLPSPEGTEILLAKLDRPIGGYLIPTDNRKAGSRIVLAASVEDLRAARHAAIHQYAHAVALAANARYPVAWGEALATWVELTLDGAERPDLQALLSERLRGLAAGLLVDDLKLAAGNALWLAFLDEAYGPTAVRVTFEELARGGNPSSALDRAVRRVSHDDLGTALAEFHVWSILVGERTDAKHFSFAHRLEAPGFASSATGLPALSVQADPAVGALGLAQVRLKPEADRGGLRVHFEGEFPASWDVDLLLIGSNGTKHRVPIGLKDGRGENTVPLDQLDQAWLLIRNLGGESSLTPRRYSYSSHHEKLFPFELGITELTASESGVLVSWETLSEQGLFGFNVLRLREDGGAAVTVNPMWIPALGGLAESTSYRFLDRGAEPGVSYLYRIQGITADGLTSQSDPVPIHLKPAAR